LPAASFSGWRPGRDALAGVYATERDRGRLQDPQERSAIAPDPTPPRSAHRRAHSGVLFGLLPKRDLTQAAGSARAGADVARGVGNSLGHSDARRAFAAGRRPGVGPATLHAARAGTSLGVGETGLGIAATTSATDP